MKKSARVSEKLVSPGLPGLGVAKHLAMKASNRLNGRRPQVGQTRVNPPVGARILKGGG